MSGRYRYRLRLPPEVRFWRRVAEPDEKGCWPWTGAHDRDGYGLFLVNINPSPDPERICMHAQRYAWIRAYGAIPGDLQVLHLCDNPACVKPAHLFLGSTVDNTRDMVTKGRQAAGERHPKWGKREPKQLQLKLRRRANTRGIANGRAKLVERQIPTIRADLRPNTVIALEYNVTPPVIGYIKRRQTWKHVP
jgi:hypothetical protein